MRSFRRLLLAFAALAIPSTAAGCDDVLGSGNRVETFYVAPEKTPCTGMFPTECLQVRKSADAAWEALYTPITGFTWEQGYTYRIRVSVREIDNPPADGSSAEYRLISVLEKTPAGNTIH